MLQKKGKPVINFHFAETKSQLPSRRKLKDFLVDIFIAEGIALSQLDYIFCSDPYLRNINITYLNHDYNTDIITFPLSEKDEPVQGEIYISLDTVKDNASRFNTRYQNELLRVVFHGALHLCGYNDKTKKDQKIMTQMEDVYLEKWNSL